MVVRCRPPGRRRRKAAPGQLRGFRTKADAQAALDELRGGVRKGTYVAPVRQSFGEFLTDDWLPAIRATVEPSTHESYSRYLRLHVIPTIGGVGLQQLDAGMLNRLNADLLDHGRRNGQPGGLTARTVRYIHTIISCALREAVAWDRIARIARNVAQAAQPPGAAQAKSPEMKNWDEPTLARFLNVVRDDRHQPAWLFLATTGCRRGEALGMRWADPVDLDTGKVVLYQTVSAINHEMRIAPRTKSGKPRPIHIDTVTVVALRVGS